MMYNTIYFDNAASSFPKPEPVTEAVYRLLCSNTSNPGRSGHFLSSLAAERVYDARCVASDFFGCTPENVIFTQNATHALNILINGMLRRGDHAVISDMEHNSVLRPLCAASSRGVSFSVAEAGKAEDRAFAFAKKIRPNTRLVICTHASNVTGTMFDISAISSVAHSAGALFALDASQTAGYTDIDMKKLGIDFLCTSGHKGLFGIQGSGMLLINCNEYLPALLYGGTGTDSLSIKQDGAVPERLEAGTLSTPAIISMAEGMKYISANKKTVVKSENKAADAAYKVLHENDRITLYSVRENSVPTISFNVSGMSSEDVTSRLSEKGICVRGGYHCSLLAHRLLGTEATGTVRMSFSPFNTASEIDIFADVLKKISSAY